MACEGPQAGAREVSRAKPREARSAALRRTLDTDRAEARFLSQDTVGVEGHDRGTERLPAPRQRSSREVRRRC